MCSSDLTPEFPPGSISPGSAAVPPAPEPVPPAGLGLRRPLPGPAAWAEAERPSEGPARARLRRGGPTRPAARGCPHGARRPPRGTALPGRRRSGGPTNSPLTRPRRAPPGEREGGEKRPRGPPPPPRRRLRRAGSAPRPPWESLRPGPGASLRGPPLDRPDGFPAPRSATAPHPGHPPWAMEGAPGGKRTACPLGDLNKALCQYCARVWALPKFHSCKYSQSFRKEIGTFPFYGVGNGGFRS